MTPDQRAELQLLNLIQLAQSTYFITYVLPKMSIDFQIQILRLKEEIDSCDKYS